MVLKTYVEGKISEVMSTIGFKNSGGRHYVHPRCDKFVEFMFGPAGIGDDVKIKPDTVTVEGQTLYIYSPTDCIRDRLASYIHLVLLLRSLPVFWHTMTQDSSPTVFWENCRC